MKLTDAIETNTPSLPTCILLPHPSSSFTPTSVEVPLQSRFGSGAGATAIFMCDPTSSPQRPSTPTNTNYIEYAHDHEEGLRAQSFVVDVMMPAKFKKGDEPVSIVVNSLNAHMGLNTLIVNLDALIGTIEVIFFDLWEPIAFKTDFVFDVGAHYMVTIARDIHHESNNYVLINKLNDGYPDDEPMNSFHATFQDMGMEDAYCNLDITYHAVASNDSKERFGSASLVNVR